jgi:hypothetical protein
MPVDTTRRRFLAVAAVASIAGAGSLAAATMAPNVPHAAGHYLLTHGPYVSKHTGLQMTGNELVLSADRAQWALTRSQGDGSNATLRPLTREEYRARILKQFPRLGKAVIS